MEKIRAALFGGSFDPPHIGHEQIIKESLKKLDISTLFIMPSYLNPFKSSFFIDPQTRFKWLLNMTKGLQKIQVCSFEIDQKRAVSTFESVEYLYGAYNIEKLYLIMGADNFKTLHKWDNYEKLMEKVELVVAKRGGENLPCDLKILDLHANISSSDLRKNLDQNYLPKSISSEIMKVFKKTKEVNEKKVN